MGNTKPTGFVPEYNIFETKEGQAAAANACEQEQQAYQELAIDLIQSFLQEKYQLDRIYELQRQAAVWQGSVQPPVQPIKSSSISCRTQLPDEYVCSDHFLHPSQSIRVVNGQYHETMPVYDNTVGKKYFDYIQAQPRTQNLSSHQSQIFCINCGGWDHYSTDCLYQAIGFSAGQCNAR
jgi:hypothetical protein